MVDQTRYYFGNAAADQVRGSGWFVGQFLSPEVGLRHQTDVELKWGIHSDGDKRPRAWASGTGTTISILIRGTLRVSLHTEETSQVVTLAKEGDYVVYGPEVAHSWEAVGNTLVLSIRFPSIEVNPLKMDVVEQGGKSIATTR
jgi:hypothetical protein